LFSRIENCVISKQIKILSPEESLTLTWLKQPLKSQIRELSCKQHSHNYYSITIQGSDREFRLRARDDLIAAKWVKEIEKAIDESGRRVSVHSQSPKDLV
jgi:hypothetical protein